MIRKRGVAYCRYSSVAQREESIHRQLDEIKKYCKTNKIELVDQYIDEAQTGTNDRRENFQLMMEDALMSDWDFVVVYKNDRLSRSVSDSFHYKKVLNKLGIRILSVIEDFDETTPEGGFFNLITMGISEFYVKNLARESFAGLMQNARRAMSTGGTPPLGFDINKQKEYVINEHEAKAVKLIFEMAVKEKSYASIARKLNDLGYRSKFGLPFKSHLTDLLKNRKYIGEFVYNRSSRKNSDGTRNNHKSKPESEVIRIPNALPRIINDKTFNKVQDLLKRRKHGLSRNGPPSKYLLSSMIQCRNCGRSITGQTSYGGRKKEYRVIYRCKTHKKDVICKTKPINALYLDDFVLKNIAFVLRVSNVKHLQQIINDKLSELSLVLKQNIQKSEDKIIEYGDEIKLITKVIANSRKNTELILNEQMYEYIEIISELKDENKKNLTDLNTIQSVYQKDLKIKQTYYRNILSKTSQRKSVLKLLIHKIYQDEKNVSININLKSFLEIELYSDLMYVIKQDRDLIAKKKLYNNFDLDEKESII